MKRCDPSGKAPKTEHRRYLEDYFRQGLGEGVFARLTGKGALIRTV